MYNTLTEVGGGGEYSVYDFDNKDCWQLLFKPWTQSFPNLNQVDLV